MSDYPIMIDDKTVGTLKVEQQGLHTVFDASADADSQLFRISVYGEGIEGYLGVMRPENGTLHFMKRLSRAAMAGFPPTMEYAGPAGAQYNSGVAEAPRSEPVERAEAAVETAVEIAEETAGAEEKCDTVWYAAPDGTLSSFDGSRLLIAMPTDNINMPKSAEGALRTINGREYIVFPR